MPCQIFGSQQTKCVKECVTLYTRSSDVNIHTYINKCQHMVINKYIFIKLPHTTSHLTVKLYWM